MLLARVQSSSKLSAAHPSTRALSTFCQAAVAPSSFMAAALEASCMKSPNRRHALLVMPFTVSTTCSVSARSSAAIGQCASTHHTIAVQAERSQCQQ
eukprot:7347-Heterococcus_DN1.PRE.1